MFLIPIDKIFPELSKHPQFYKQLVFKAPLCITLTISDQKIVSPVVGFDPRNMKKPPQKVALQRVIVFLSKIVKNFFSVKNRLPTTHDFLVRNRDCNTERGFKIQLYIELG